jgi:hypothetical protein
MPSSSIDEGRQIRKFGLIAFLFFGTLAGAGIWRQKPIAICLFGALATLGLGFMLLPAPLKPVYDGWLRVAHAIGRGVTTIMLTVAYYVVITPAAWLKRVFGGRPLPTAPDPEKSSYWVMRTEPVQPKDRFYKRY